MGVLRCGRSSRTSSDAVDRFTDRTDAAILRQIARLRTDWLTECMNGIDRLGSGWAMTTVRLGV